MPRAKNEAAAGACAVLAEATEFMNRVYSTAPDPNGPDSEFLAFCASNGDQAMHLGIRLRTAQKEFNKEAAVILEHLADVFGAGATAEIEIEKRGRKP